MTYNVFGGTLLNQSILQSGGMIPNIATDLLPILFCYAKAQGYRQSTEMHNSVNKFQR